MQPSSGNEPAEEPAPEPPSPPPSDSAGAKGVIGFGAAVFFGLFVVTWGAVCVKTIRYTPTDLKPRLELETELSLFAGFTAATIATATATWLGITIQEVKAQQRTARLSDSQQVVDTLWKTVLSVLAFARGRPLAFGCYSYIGTGAIVGLVWVFNTSVAPETMKAFALSLLGWLAGTVTVAYAKD